MDRYEVVRQGKAEMNHSVFFLKVFKAVSAMLIKNGRLEFNKFWKGGTKWSHMMSLG